MRDLSLKDGEKINIKVKLPRGEGRKHIRPNTGCAQLPTPPGGSVALLPPPPGDGVSSTRPEDSPASPTAPNKSPPQQADSQGVAAQPAALANTEFGDFADADHQEGGHDEDFGDFEAA
mmetsp:Transcript_8452/g.25287  ORF Transcript_8452/g.25287 Transcript_8452/m.25287 type:complete len:119 (+) Transcript_8452:694-1050(+)